MQEVVLDPQLSIYLFSVVPEKGSEVVILLIQILGLRVLHVGPEGHGQAEHGEEYGLQKFIYFDVILILCLIHTFKVSKLCTFTFRL